MQIEVTEPTEYTYRGYETASWWTRYEIQPGIYDVVPWSNLPHYRHFKCKAVIIEDYFASSFAGASVQPYDTKRNAGKKVEVFHPFPGTYLDNTPSYALWFRDHPTFRLVA